MGHLITGSLGAGMMALPIAFKHVGLSIGIIGTILISSLASYCMHQLVSANKDNLNKKHEEILLNKTVTGLREDVHHRIRIDVSFIKLEGKQFSKILDTRTFYRREFHYGAQSFMKP